MHRALLSWELLCLVCCPSYIRLNNPAVPASAALTQAGISTAAHRVGRWWVLTSQESSSVLMSLINLTSFTWDPGSAPRTFLSSVRAVPVPSMVPAAGSVGALQVCVAVPCCCLLPWMNLAVTGQVAWCPVLSLTGLWIYAAGNLSLTLSCSCMSSVGGVCL